MLSRRLNSPDDDAQRIMKSTISYTDAHRD